MQSLLTTLQEHRLNCGQYGSDLRAAYGLHRDQPPVNAFEMCFNNATITFELCHYYYQVWSKIEPRFDADIIAESKERNERLIVQTKMLFIFGTAKFRRHVA